MHTHMLRFLITAMAFYGSLMELRTSEVCYNNYYDITPKSLIIGFNGESVEYMAVIKTCNLHVCHVKKSVSAL